MNFSKKGFGFKKIQKYQVNKEKQAGKNIKSLGLKACEKQEKACVNVLAKSALKTADNKAIT